MIRKTTTLAIVLLIVGVAGSIFTFKAANKTEDVTEEKVINDDFNNIEVTANEAEVEILPTSDSQAKVELSGKNSNYRLSTGVEGSTLKVDVAYKQKKLFNFDFTLASLSLKVYLPEKEYNSLQIESGNGRVRVDDLQAKVIHVKTDNGQIKLNHIGSSEVTAEADNGTIDMENVTATNVKVKADNGKIKLKDVEGNLSGTTNNGSISLVTRDLHRSIDFETDNGRINIQTEKKPTNAIIDAKVDNGKVTVFGESNWDTVIGEGENLIKLTTKNGTITVIK
ncbi:MAG TPA: DUF4097 family beta strand repeat-containing protein [Virgibacillus sp.]|nr:DUF4097 family beta strand repeat-containing protein [Virgibacillus sp.]